VQSERDEAWGGGAVALELKSNHNSGMTIHQKSWPYSAEEKKTLLRAEVGGTNHNYPPGRRKNLKAQGGGKLKPGDERVVVCTPRSGYGWKGDTPRWK